MSTYNASNVESFNSDLVVPKDRIQGLKENWKSDIMSGFIISLIALPLSLAIAIASGAPPMAGIFAAIIGGIVVSQLTKSHVTINGPAAGLIVVMCGAVEGLGGGATGYHCTTAAVFISGVVLAILGRFKAGVLGYLVPATVVHGMLAAIGLIIIAKELPVFFGIASKIKEPLQIYAHVPQMVANMNPEIALIGGAAMVILIAFTVLRRWTIVRRVPAPLVVVIAGICFGLMFDLEHAHSYTFANHQFLINPKQHLVLLPSNITDAFALPDWSKAGSFSFWYWTIVIILIQGVETLLSCAAVDKLDPYKRPSDLSADLTAVGVGTAISGAIGGLPMITEIVRSSANVASGARTRWSNFAHGMFILLFVLIGSSVINLIPQAALAALLMMVGFRLASPAEFKHVWEIGPDQLFIYCATIIGVLATDLLVGVGIGILCKVILEVCSGAPIGKYMFIARSKCTQEGDRYQVSIEGSATFSNFLSLKSQIDKIPAGKQVVLDLSHATFIDHSAMEHLNRLCREYARTGGRMELVGTDHHKARSSHHLASRRLANV